MEQKINGMMNLATWSDWGGGEKILINSLTIKGSVIHPPFIQEEKKKKLLYSGEKKEKRKRNWLKFFFSADDDNNSDCKRRETKDVTMKIQVN